MNAQVRTLAFAAIAAVNAFGMSYEQTILPIVPIFPPPPPPVLSGCYGDTLAVGIEYFGGGGARILCADAGQIGFWTAATPSTSMGTISSSGLRILCPSGSALSGVAFSEGFPLPLPACSVLIPNLQNGTVSRGAITSGGIGGLCAGSKFVQTLQGTFNSLGALTAFTAICNPVVTAAAPIENFDVDLAIRTIGERPGLNHSTGSDAFTVQVFNTGIGTLPAGNIRVEFRFNTAAWSLVPASNMACKPLVSAFNSRLITAGVSCTMPGTSIGARGGSVSANITISAVGPDSGRPVTGVAAPIVSSRVVLTQGTAPNVANDSAAFPVLLF